MDNLDLSFELRKIAKKLAALGTPEEAEQAAQAEKSDPEMRKLRNRMRDQLTLNSPEVKEAFTQYAVTAIWSSTDDEGEPLDKEYDMSDLSESARSTMLNELFDFTKQVSRLIPDHNFNLADLAHDFWLTRNGHGSGFWDNQGKPWANDQIAQKLTDISKNFGQQELYVGDDGKIHVA